MPPSSLSKKDRREYQKLQGLSGQAFDREYIAMMVMDHRNDLKEFKTEASSGNDPKVKDLAAHGSEVVSQHLQMIEQIAKAHDVDVGTSGSMGAQ
jgi:putative membrane protein